MTKSCKKKVELRLGRKDRRGGYGKWGSKTSMGRIY